MKKLLILTLFLIAGNSTLLAKEKKALIENKLPFPVVIEKLGCPPKTLNVLQRHDIGIGEKRHIKLAGFRLMALYPQPILDNTSKHNRDKNGDCYFNPYIHLNIPMANIPDSDIAKLKLSLNTQNQHLVSADVKITPRNWHAWESLKKAINNQNVHPGNANIKITPKSWLAWNFLKKEEKIATLYFVKNETFYKNPKLSAKEIVEKYKKELN